MQRTINILRDIRLEANTAYGQLEPEDPLITSLLFIINMADDEIERLEEQ